MFKEAHGVMSKEEIAELVDLRFGGYPSKLAADLNMTEMAVRRWLDGTRNCKGGCAILLKQWLAEARRKAARAS